MACFPTLATQASAQHSASAYQASFFTQYTPQNAMEMVDRLPGFSFDEGSNARGFGGNAGNVLIDGSRPTSKSGGLKGALTRIPAAQVERIEIIRGGAGAGEAAGQSIVANIIRNQSSTSGTWALKTRKVQGANAEPNLEAAISTQLGKWETSFDTDIGGSPGFRSAIFDIRDSRGELLTGAAESLVERNRWAYFNGEGSKAFEIGKLTLNGRLGGDSWRGDVHRDSFDKRLPDGEAIDGFDDFNPRNREREAEFGADWTQTGELWKWRLIGLATVENEKFENSAHNVDFIEGSESRSGYVEDSTESEYIIRTTFTEITESPLKPEFGIEVANNELDTESLSTDNGVVQNLGNDTVVVEEKRAEAFATTSYQISEQLSIEAGLTFEFSTIEVTGGEAQKQTFQFYKPRFSATYQIDDDSSFIVEAERRVGQLDFDDFASSNDLEDDRQISGNSNLQPDKTTELAFTYDLSFSQRGSLKIRAFHEWRKDILEDIKLVDDPVDPVYGLGNAGEARFWGVDTDINLPLDFILPNGLLELSHFYRGSEFHDPIIAADRIISDYTDNGFNFTLRQDLTEYRLTWGVEYRGHFIEEDYKVNELRTFRGNNRTEFFIETTRFWNVKTRLEVSNSNTGKYTRTRHIYDVDRNGPLNRVERASRFRKPLVVLSFSGTF